MYTNYGYRGSYDREGRTYNPVNEREFRAYREDREEREYREYEDREEYRGPMRNDEPQYKYEALENGTVVNVLQAFAFIYGLASKCLF